MMKTRFFSHINDIPSTQWNAINNTDYPFLSHEFLSALEYKPLDQELAACCIETGWQAHHAAIYDDSNNSLLAVMPLYIKQHSYGEYIFDWAWAQAYQRHGVDYYPKLYTGIPFTPASGPRIAFSSAVTDKQSLLEHLVNTIKTECLNLHASSFHLLFSDQAISNAVNELGLTQRSSFQYHWKNQNINKEPFSDFNDFISLFKSRKRKALLKERQNVKAKPLNIKRLTGNDINTEIWDRFYTFYQNTYSKRSGHGGYLPSTFFHTIGKTLGNKVMLVVAEKDETIIAAALNFYSSTTLFGRYWGAAEDHEFLHFELCYYQGIEFCIEQGLTTFDAGAQGEHKIQRGFQPIETFSNHWIANKNFTTAINNFIAEEAAQNKQYMDKAKTMLPFKT